MKNIVFILLVAVALAGCSDNGPDELVVYVINTSDELLLVHYEHVEIRSGGSMWANAAQEWAWHHGCVGAEANRDSWLMRLTVTTTDGTQVGSDSFQVTCDAWTLWIQPTGQLYLEHGAVVWDEVTTGKEGAYPPWERGRPPSSSHPEGEPA